MKLESQNKITYEGPISVVTLADGLRLYGPATVPDRLFARKKDQITICAVNERSTADILMFEHMNGILETDDIRRSPSMQRWHLVDVFLMTGCNIGEHQ